MNESQQKAFKDYKKGMKYKNIAKKYDVSENTVKSWATRYWKSEKVAKSGEKIATFLDKKLQPKSPGAPKKNKNAIGNSGGAPKGSKNAQTHGGYTDRWDCIDENEKNMIENIVIDEEQEVIYNIKLFIIRERRLMSIISQLKDKPFNVALAGFVRTEEKIDFNNEEEKKLYDELKKQKIEDKKISYLGQHYSQTTQTEVNLSVIQRLENELTRVQNAKTRAISDLHKIRQAKSESSGKDNEMIDDWIFTIKGDE